MSNSLFETQLSFLRDLTIDKLSSLYKSILPGNYVEIIYKCTEEVRKPLVYCLQYTTHNRQFTDAVILNALHTGHYCIFLYFLSRSLRQNSFIDLADVIFSLNKMMHSIDIYHQVILPKVFHLEHPLGSVIGKASFGNFLYIGQGCTVGRNMNPNSSHYPSFGDCILLTSYVTIVGKTQIGSNVIFSSGSFVKDETIPDNCLVFGKSPNLTIKSLTKCKSTAYFRQMFYI